jgi:hypothetical protein
MTTWQQAIQDLKNQSQQAVNDFARETRSALAAATPKKTGNAARNWQNIPYKAGETGVILQNNVPYIEPLNAGHSKQAPAHYVEQTIQTIVNKFDRKHYP